MTFPKGPTLERDWPSASIGTVSGCDAAVHDALTSAHATEGGVASAMSFLLRAAGI